MCTLISVTMNDDMFAASQFLVRQMIESATPGLTEWIGPTLSQHTDEVLKAFAYDAAAISRLRATATI